MCSFWKKIRSFSHQDKMHWAWTFACQLELLKGSLGTLIGHRHVVQRHLWALSEYGYDRHMPTCENTTSCYKNRFESSIILCHSACFWVTLLGNKMAILKPKKLCQQINVISSGWRNTTDTKADRDAFCTHAIASSTSPLRSNGWNHCLFVTFQARHLNYWLLKWVTLITLL